MVHFWYLPLTNILMWAVSHALNVDIQQYVWPIIWNLIKKAEESYKNLSCVCTLDRYIRLAKPNQSQVVGLHSRCFVVLPSQEEVWTNYVTLLLSHFVSLVIRSGVM